MRISRSIPCVLKTCLPRAAAYGAVPHLGLAPSETVQEEPLIRTGLWETQLGVDRILRTDNPDAMRLWEAAFELEAPQFCVTADEAIISGVGFSIRTAAINARFYPRNGMPAKQLGRR